MTRFMQEISGELGEFWKKHAQQDVDHMINKYKTGELIIEDDGAAKWRCNGSYIPDECVEHGIYGGLPISREATMLKRVEEIEKFAEEYKKQKHICTEEDINELRAAFGLGQKIVDVISGEVIYT